MTKYEDLAIGAFVALVVGDWIVRLLSWDISDLGDGVLFWFRLLFSAFLLLWAVLLVWVLIGMASAGLAWLLLAGSWRFVRPIRSVQPFHDRKVLHFVVGTCLFLLAYVGRHTHPGLFLDVVTTLAWVYELLLGAPA